MDQPRWPVQQTQEVLAGNGFETDFRHDIDWITGAVAGNWFSS